MEYWIDDERSPYEGLKKEEAENVIWIDKINVALIEIESNAEKITTIYLDHYMDHQYVFGNEIIFLVLYLGKEEYFKNLDNIFLHSSDLGVIEDLLHDYKEELKNIGVNLQKANY